MTLESNAWRTVRSELSPYGRLVRIENRIGLGTPDVYYRLISVAGWIEMKTDLSTLTIEQVMWAEEEHRAAGRAFLLYHSDGSSWWLYRAPCMKKLMEQRKDVKYVEGLAAVASHIGFPTKEILRCLTES
jgi:hypothetical protein